jgi:lipid II:glycine glycyltransferase (peptidoglycan interpeptide bridge formation enzyme)
MILETKRGKVLNSLPFYGSNGGVLADTEEAAHLLLGHYNQMLADEHIISSTLIENPFAQVCRSLSAAEHNFSDVRIAQYTDLTRFDDEAGFLEMIDGSTRRNIKKAQRANVVVSKDFDFDYLFAIHQANMQAIGGKAKSKIVFDLMPSYFEKEKDYSIYIAYKDGQKVAALLIFYFNQVVEYFTPVIENEFRSDQPLAAILSAAMQEAKQRGFKLWNWGGTWETQGGVHAFKSKWAASESRYHYYTKVLDKSLLNLTAEAISNEFPNFYVLPFSALSTGSTR